MFERFSERARQVVVLAQDEARTLNQNYIGTEHILLGLLREEGLAARVLDSCDVTLEEARAAVARIVGRGEEATAGQIPFTPRAKKVLELALREALSLGHNYIGAEHILLALASQVEGAGAQVLRDFGATATQIRAKTLEFLRREHPGGSSRGVTVPQPISGGASGRSQQLRISCPKCGAGIETISTDADNTRFEVSAEGDRTCPSCGKHWTISYAVTWLERPEHNEI